MIYLDTHVVVWLYTGDRGRLTPEILSKLDADLLISPMVELELALLHETGRLVPTSTEVVIDLERRIGLRICDLPFRDVATFASQLHWTRDPFDRVIVGQASASGQPLATRDRTIRQHYARAFWD
jgi:PIN domain nuclease of toxin-antitoxin system